MTQPDPYRQAADATAPKPARHWLSGVLWWMFILGLGAAYGIFGYRFFEGALSTPAQGKSGLMLLSFLGAVPLVIGAGVVYLAGLRQRIGFMQALSLSGVPVLVVVFVAGTILREGFICILMALPLFLLVAGIGAIAGWLATSLSRKQSGKVMCVAVLVPFFLGAGERNLPAPDRVRSIHRSVLIQAPAPVIWQLVNYPTGIRPEELGPSLAYYIGVPYPIEARTLQPGVGGMRKLKWQRGVSFDEQIISWEENRHIAWRYIFGPDSFPPGSLDEHIRLGGQYFDLVDTAYTLTPQDGGTRLDIDLSYRVSTHFNWYAGPWANFLLGDAAEAILHFYQHRAESGTTAPGLVPMSPGS
jgi:hypothetical protein